MTTQGNSHSRKRQDGQPVASRDFVGEHLVQSDMTEAFRKAFFDHLGLVSLLDIVRRLRCLS